MSKPKAAKVRELEPGIWEYTDGSIRRANGTMVRRAGSMLGAPVIDKALSADYNERQRDMYQSAAEAGMVKGTGAKTREAAWSRIVEARARVAVENEGDPGNRAAEFVGRQIGASREAGSREPEGMSLRMTPAAVREFRMLIETLKGPAEAGPGDTIDGEAVELSPAEAEGYIPGQNLEG